MAPGPFPALERLCGGSRPGKPVFGVDTLSPARKRFQFTEWYTLGQRTFGYTLSYTGPLLPPRKPLEPETNTGTLYRQGIAKSLD
jgi:hypothetical protein